MKHPDISINEMKELLDFISNTVSYINDVTSSDIDANKVKIKLNINSPGLVEISTAILEIAFGVSALFLTLNLFLNGGSVKMKLKDKVDLEAKSEGFLEKLMKSKKVTHKISLEEKQLEEQFNKLLNKGKDIQNNLNIKLPPKKDEN